MPASPSSDLPQFEISSEQGTEGVWVVHVAGEVDISHEEELRNELREALAQNTQGIVVDLTDCEFIDSSGVRTLLLSREAQHAKGETERLAVAASSEQILRILGVMGIDKVIPVRPTVDEATSELSS
jgi:anti-sigma B factor antagonist